MSVKIRSEILEAYRSKTFRKNPADHLSNKEDAIQFVNERGFVLFHPAKGVILPSLWVATAGDRPVPNEHDDPGHRCWGWKDESLNQRLWFYGRLIYKKMSMISFDLLPYFYALSPNYGDWQNDYMLQYKEGIFGFECKNIYEALLSEGPMDTLKLREKANLWGSHNQYRYTKALNQLQSEMKITPVGIAEAGRWNYAFIFDIVPRYYDTLEETARNITQTQARVEIARKFFLSVGCADFNAMRKVLGWQQKETEKIAGLLQDENFIVQADSLDDQRGSYLALPVLLI